MTSYTEYLITSFRHRINNPHLRLGQVLFNQLTSTRPELASKLHGSELDPFYVVEGDPNRAWVVEGFLIWVEENWR